MASANCQIVDGVPDSNCTEIGNSGSGMWYGNQPNNMTQVSGLQNFQWVNTGGDTGIRAGETGATETSKDHLYHTLYFAFKSDSGQSRVSGQKTTDATQPDYPSYTIDIHNSDTFLLNAGDKTLYNNLNITFEENANNSYFFKAKDSVGLITLNGSKGGDPKGNFTADLTNGLVGTFKGSAQAGQTYSFVNNGATAIINQSGDTIEDPSKGRNGNAALITNRGKTTWNATGTSQTLKLATGHKINKEDYTKFSIWAKNSGTNTINAGNADLTTAGHIMAGGRDNPSKGENTIQVKTLTLDSGKPDIKANISVAGADGILSQNTITAIGTDTTGKAPNGSITLKAGDIQAYFYGENVIKAGSLELTTGNIVAGDGGNPNKTDAKNTITLTTGNSSIAGRIEAVGAGSVNAFTIIGSSGGTTMEVNGGISATGADESKGKNNFTLNATNGVTKLTLNGTNNTIDTFTALGGNTANHNRLDFGVKTTDTKEIKGLILGNDEMAGLLTITNGIGSILTIGTFESKYTDSKLTLYNNAKVNIENIKGKNNNIEMGSNATLTLNGGFLNSLTSTNGANEFNVVFAKGETTIAKGLSKVNSVKRYFTLTGSAGEGTKAIINGEIALGSPATIPENNFTLNSSAEGTTNLTLGGAGDKTLTSLTALSASGQAINTLTINTEAGATNEIITLNLGEGTGSGGSPTTTGFLTITNNSENALTIGTFTNNHQDNVLTIAKGEVAITNALTGTDKNKFALKGATLTLNNTTGGSTITSLTTTETNNINFVKDATTIKSEITAGETNNFTLTGVNGAATSAVFEGAISGTNNFTLDSSASNTTSLTLQGTTGNAINDFTALGGNDVGDNKLTIDAGASGKNEIKSLVLGAAAVDGSKPAEKGLLTIENNAVDASGGKVALTITNLTANGQDSKLVLSGAYDAIGELTLGDRANLTLDASAAKDSTGGNSLLIVNTFKGAGGKLTISKGAVEMKALGDAGENNIALSDTTSLTLNGGTLNSLGTTGTTTINFAKGNTIIEGAITAGTKNDFKLTGKDSGTSATFNGVIGATGGTNNFTLDSANGATTLTLGGTGAKTLTSLTALSANDQAINTLTIDTNAAATNKITTLNLGDSSGGGSSTTTGFLTITNNSTQALEIGTFTSAATGNILTISGGVTITDKIADTIENNIALKGATLTLTNGGKLKSLLTTEQKENTINLNGDTEITDQITAGADVTNNFHIGKDANSAVKLTLTGGFSTTGGKNSFTIYKNGTLDLGAQLSGNELTTTNGTTEFIIKEGATFELLQDKTITATNKGTNIIKSSGTITLGAITADGGGSKNEITIDNGKLTLGTITSTNSGENYFIIGDEKGSPNTATLTLGTTSVTTEKGGTTSFTINDGSELTFTDAANSTLTANGANNVFTIKNGATVNTAGGNKFYNAIEATNNGKNIIKTSANLNLNTLTASGGTNDITLRGKAGTATAMEVAGAISGTGQNNFTLDSTASNTTSLTLKGTTGNAINDFIALGGTAADSNKLIIDVAANKTNKIENLVLGAATADGTSATAGVLTIENNAEDSGAKVALTITNFEGKHADSKLTISSGKVNIEKLGGEETNHNNIDLGDGSELTLNGGNLNSLSTAKGITGTHTITFAKGKTTITSGITAGANVTNKINLSGGATLTSTITANGAGAINTITLANNSNITGDITASQSGSNTITLTGTTTITSAIINGAISGTGNNITLDSSANTGEKTNLTLGSGGGSAKIITKLTALSAGAQAMNTLTIENGAGQSSIDTLALGEQSGSTNKGFLTITNNSENALKIGAFTSADTTNNILTINKGKVEITGNLTSATNANFTLDSQAAEDKANLIISNAGGNTITKLTALSADDKAMNTLTIDKGANGKNEITDLVLGEGGNKSGHLTIDNQAASNALTINKLTSNADSKLIIGENSDVTIAAGALQDTNHNIALKADTNLTLNGGSLALDITDAGTNKNITFASNTTTITDKIAAGGTNNFTLTGTGGTTKAIFNGAISGANNFTLDSSAGGGVKTALTLNGASNAINTFTALGGADVADNILIISAGASGTIGNLVLGAAAVGSGSATKGLLTIANSGGALGIGTLTTNADSALTLSGKYGAIGTLALENGANLTLDASGVKDSAGQKPLVVNTFTGNSGKLTITAGAMEITNTLKGENSTIALGTGTALTLNGGTLKSLTTAGETTITFASNTTTITSADGISAGASVKNNIKLGEGATLASAITANDAGAENNITLANNSSITKDITATSGTNTITLTGTSATIDGNLIQQNSGANKISFDSQLESQTLHLKGKNNTITTLKLGKSNIINLAGDKDKNGGINSRGNDFRLLTIGTKSATPSTGIGLLNPNGATLTFESYINPSANNQSQTLSNNKATLGGEQVQTDSDGKATNPLGYAYSDRVIIHNAGDNSGQGQAKGKYQFKAYYANPNDLGSIKYNKEGGTEQEGNIALFTIAKVSGGSNQGIIEFETQGNNKENNNNSQVKSTTAVGLSNTITTTLTQVATDQYGKTANSNGALQEGDKNYLTYFIDKVEVASIPDEGIGGGTGGSIPPYIKKSANLMIQSMAVSAVNLYLANFNSLNKRMGELRDNAYSKGVWARTFIGSQSNDFGLSDRTGYFSLQAGFDGTIKTEKANNFIGFAISYSKNFGYSSNQKNLNGIKGPHLSLDSLNAQLVELALYNSYVSNEGWYNDTIGKFSYIQNSMSVKDERKGVDGINGANAKLNTFAFTLSNEVGYRAKLGEDKAWFIDPQAELALGHINGMNFKLNHYKYPYSVSISSAINLRARAGASIGYDFKNFTQDKGIDAKVYVGAFYEMDSFHYTDGSKGIRYQSSQFNSIDEVKAIDFDHRAVLNVGTNLTIKDATRLYLDFEKSFGGKITTDYKINAGVRYSFGEALSEKGKEVLKDKEGESVESETKAPLKIKEKGEGRE